MPRRRFARGIGSRRKRRLTWRANANRNQVIPNVTGTPAMFALRPSAGWENTEPTLVRVRGHLWGGGTLPPFQATPISQWAITLYVGLIMGNQPNGFLNGQWSAAVPVDLEDEQVIYAGVWGLTGPYGLLDQTTPASVGVFSTSQLSPLVIDTKARRKIRNENDELWLSVACFGSTITNATASWIMRFLYAVDF